MTALSASLKDASEDDMRMMRNKELIVRQSLALLNTPLGGCDHLLPLANFRSDPEEK